MNDLLAQLTAFRAEFSPLLEPLAKLLGAIAVAVMIHAAIFAFLQRGMLQEDTFLTRFLHRARRPLRLALALLAIALVTRSLTFPDRLAAILGHGVLIAIIVLIGWSVMVVMDLLTERSLRHHRLDTADNLMARKFLTQVRILRQAVTIVTVLLTVAAVLMTFEGVRRYGVSLFASAGAAGLVVGLAARPVLSNLIAGIQIALTQPIRIDDVVVVEGEWGWIEEIFATFVVVRIWDWRRLVVPLSYFIEQPFQNWTRQNATIMGSVFWYVDYTMPVEEMRAEVERIIRASPRWDGKVANLQVVETDKEVMQLRALMSSHDSPTNWDLRCEVREKIIGWIQSTHPASLPRLRAEMVAGDGASLSGHPSEAAPRPVGSA
ncbi:mechanosensitive ion channel domain-containing protein [uncultured Jannaschia sp.]|uniref:mechanosensitive ion channel family protein n=1 Tax=uncultured Jannaschia sp. TaxID=293347 RepID=UPI002625A33B|nr:mechanosensitive ion channel domain-containing protein [uncultured Jannaschia sp.]